MGVLAGIRVLDLGRLVAGPFAGQMLADLGADVIKIERPGLGDVSRTIAPPRLKDRDGNPLRDSAISLAVNRNKRSIELDISRPEGQAVLKGLTREADVLIENLRAGDLARYGLGHADLRAINPDLIYCSISGYGQDGPYASRSAKDTALQAMSGLMSLNGEADGLPQKVGFVIADVNAGLYAAIAILGALRHREVLGGGGQHIDLSLLDCQIATLSHRFQQYLITGASPKRNGGIPAGTALVRPLECRDEWIAVSVDADNEFPVFAGAIGRPDLAGDPRFIDQASRTAHVETLLAEIVPVMKSRPAREWVELLSAQRLVCSTINSVAQALEEPQVGHRGMKVEVEHPQVGRLSILANPIRYSASPIEGYRRPPLQGEHTDDLLTELLGLGAAEITRLRDDGII